MLAVLLSGQGGLQQLPARTGPSPAAGAAVGPENNQCKIQLPTSAQTCRLAGCEAQFCALLDWSATELCRRLICAKLLPRHSMLRVGIISTCRHGPQLFVMLLRFGRHKHLSLSKTFRCLFAVCATSGTKSMSPSSLMTTFTCLSPNMVPSNLCWAG
jgi:hypothetical protein